MRVFFEVLFPSCPYAIYGWRNLRINRDGPEKRPLGGVKGGFFEKKTPTQSRAVNCRFGLRGGKRKNQINRLNIIIYIVSSVVHRRRRRHRHRLYPCENASSYI